MMYLKIAASALRLGSGYFLLIVAMTIPRLIAPRTTSSKLHASLNVIRPPPFEVDRPAFVSEKIITQMAKNVNSERKYHKPPPLTGAGACDIMTTKAVSRYQRETVNQLHDVLEDCRFRA